ncbi:MULTISPECIES: sensor histidine kinase [Xanthocytophaga]|uniref:histidine kinase n=2 Tax=Xanthocytophaga TaxID=3078918 RepID=A0AAE3UAN1_9BACT|nr:MULTISPECIES: ATP-binding protein [Xanthocytophaga]MDJ1484892.1 ATP-binding protein [Xanthocytophaga flavus]MDJ1506735.1 ATP-binding protein [Xanthocytophaga agilis]
MLFGSKGVSLLAALLIACITTVFLAFVDNVSERALVVTFSLSFLSSFLFIYVALEFLVFRELNMIYTMLDKIKQKDFKVPKKRIFRDANPVKRLNEEIYTYATRKQQEIDELKRMEEYRREFVANISHELKTPIFAAQGFIHTLLDGAIEDEKVRDKFLEKSARSLDNLNILVQDLLTLSRMESGEIKMQFSHFDLYQLTSDIFEQLEETAIAKNIKLKFDKHQIPKMIAYADKNRISQVMTNLIDNAIKYGNEAGKVVVEIESEKDQLVVSVRDDGPGIEPEHLKRIFERFYRVEKSRSKDSGGTGLGLAITKHIVEAHGSKITVTSKPGKGTQFRFKLPKGKGE